eukprot:PhM_4_TR17059/c1_g1_i5/m.90366
MKKAHMIGFVTYDDTSAPRGCSYTASPALQCLAMQLPTEDVRFAARRQCHATVGAPGAASHPRNDLVRRCSKDGFFNVCVKRRGLHFVKRESRYNHPAKSPVYHFTYPPPRERRNASDPQRSNTLCTPQNKRITRSTSKCHEMKIKDNKVQK